MPYSPRRSRRLVHLECPLAFEEAVSRLERALARSPWRVTARVDGRPSAGSTPVCSLVIAPRGFDPIAEPQDLTCSLLLGNEVVVQRADGHGRVTVTYCRPDVTEWGEAPLLGHPPSQWQRWLDLAVAEAVAAPRIADSAEASHRVSAVG